MERKLMFFFDLFFIVCASEFGYFGYKQIQERIIDIDYLGGMCIATSIVFFLASIKDK